MCCVCNWGVGGRISLTVGDENLYSTEIGHTFQYTSTTNRGLGVCRRARACLPVCVRTF